MNYDSNYFEMMRERKRSAPIRHGDDESDNNAPTPKADVDQVGVEVRVADDRIHRTGLARIRASAEETNPCRRRRHSAW